MITRDAAPSLVIFDCDGVLVDSEPIVLRVLAEHLRRYGVDLADEHWLDRLIGVSEEESNRLLASLFRGAVPDGWFSELAVAVDQALANEVRPVAGVVNVLDTLDTLTVPFCVASNGHPSKLALTLKTSGLAGYFDGRVFTAADVVAGKPAPDLFLHAAKRMGAPTSRCVVVEDSFSGVAAGRAAGMTVLGYAGAGTTEAVAAADRVFSDMSDLPGLLHVAED
ncbi:MAG: HAD family hydrolase [Micromonosporaceae bacterium]|nr:HAD family hydrolase [Micromonosporaceae bacterium]